MTVSLLDLKLVSKLWKSGGAHNRPGIRINCRCNGVIMLCPRESRFFKAEAFPWGGVSSYNGPSSAQQRQGGTHWRCVGWKCPVGAVPISDMLPGCGHGRIFPPGNPAIQLARLFTSEGEASSSELPLSSGTFRRKLLVAGS